MPGDRVARVMKLFVGLGNPGAKYAQNRHNIGFRALDRIAEDHGFGPWRSKFQGLVSEGRLGDTKIILLKPETFMNRSGQSVGEALRFIEGSTQRAPDKPLAGLRGTLMAGACLVAGAVVVSTGGPWTFWAPLFALALVLALRRGG